MAHNNPIHLEPDNQLASLLREINGTQVVFEVDGIHYCIERQAQTPFADYDPVAALTALQKSVGALAGIDIEQFKEDLKVQREQDSIGRPR